MSSSEPPRKPTEAELALVAKRFTFTRSWGRGIFEFKRLLKISGFKGSDFDESLSLNPILIFIPERDVYFLNRNPRNVRRAAPGGRKNQKTIQGMELTGEEIIKLAEEFRSVDLEWAFLYKFLQAKKLMNPDPKAIECGFNGEEWVIDASKTLFNLSSLRDKLKDLGIPEEGIRIKLDADNQERLFISRSSLQYFMRDQVPSEKKKHFEADMAPASKEDSKSGVEGYTVPHREGPPGGLAWDDAEKDKDKEHRIAPEPRTSPRKP